MKKKYYKSENCLNCNTHIGKANYCPNCGQLNSDKRQTFKQLVTDFLGEYFTFDSRFFATFIPLVMKPGQLTNDYNKGKRASYILPLRLYMFTTFLFFLIITIQSKISSSGIETQKNEMIAAKDSFNVILDKYPFEMQDRFKNEIDSTFNFKLKATNTRVIITGTPSDSLEPGFKKYLAEKLIDIGNLGKDGWRTFWQELLNQIPKIMFILLPVFALLLKLFYIRRKILYINHLIFSLHVHTVIFIYLLLASLIQVWYIILLILFGIWLHLFIAFRKVYQQSRWKTFFKLNLILFIYWFVLLIGFALLVVLTAVSL